MEIISRKEAVELGRSKYFTGQPCKRGHVAQRYTTSGTCSACIAASSHTSRKQLNQTLAAQASGLVHFEAKVRPQDVAMLRDLIAAWIASGPAIATPPAPGVPAAPALPPLDIQAERARILGLAAAQPVAQSWAESPDGQYRG